MMTTVRRQLCVIINIYQQQHNVVECDWDRLSVSFGVRFLWILMNVRLSCILYEHDKFYYITLKFTYRQCLDTRRHVVYIKANKRYRVALKRSLFVLIRLLWIGWCGTFCYNIPLYFVSTPQCLYRTIEAYCYILIVKILIMFIP